MSMTAMEARTQVRANIQQEIDKNILRIDAMIDAAIKRNEFKVVRPLGTGFGPGLTQAAVEGVKAHYIRLGYVFEIEKDFDPRDGSYEVMTFAGV